MNVIMLVFLAAGVMFLVLQLITENRIFSGLTFACLGLEFLMIYFKNRENIIDPNKKVMLFTSVIMVAVGLAEVVSKIIK